MHPARQPRTESSTTISPDQFDNLLSGDWLCFRTKTVEFVRQLPAPDHLEFPSQGVVDDTASLTGTNQRFELLLHIVIKHNIDLMGHDSTSGRFQ
jgi:hypothetical protein